MRTHRATVLTGVVAAALLLTQQACTPAERHRNAPVSFTVPESTTPAPADPILTGHRQIVIRPLPSTESILALDPRGRLTTTDGETDHGLFVLTPVGDKYLIKTAKTRAGGEPSCLGIDGSAPLTVAAAPCDTGRAGQLFTITAQRPSAYAIGNGDAYLQVSPTRGVIAEERGDAPLTTYALVDNGPSTLPDLD